MSIILGGYSANSKLEVEANTLAAKVSQRPIDWSPVNPYVGGGSYSRKLVSGSMTSGGFSGSLFQIRWVNSQVNAAVTKVKFTCFLTGSGGAQPFGLSLFPARQFSAAGSGGTAWSGANNDGRRRSVMGPTSVNDMRIDSTAATGITNGTWVLDADPLAAMFTSWVAAAFAYEEGKDGVQTGRQWPLWETLPGEAPIILSAQEGLDIVMGGAALGTATVGVSVEWHELMSPP